MNVSHLYLDIHGIELDPSNPRIAHDLETYSDTDLKNSQTLEWALNPGDAKFSELKQAIITQGGIINPIIVNHVDNKYWVIEGNTRLAIYRILNKEHPEVDKWKSISTFVHEDMSPREIDAIRLQAHLVGIRNWKPFAKAKYLYQLYELDNVPLQELVDFCGGDKTKVQRTINAYKEMIEYYKPLVDDDHLTDKFSIFLESQAPKIKNILLRHHFTPNDLAKWVAEGKFEPRQELIRKLPSILENTRSREVFLEKGASDAEMYIDRPKVADELASASVAELCQAIQTVIDNVSRRELKVIREKTDIVEDTIKAIAAFYDEELKTNSEIPIDIEIS